MKHRGVRQPKNFKRQSWPPYNDEELRHRNDRRYSNYQGNRNRNEPVFYQDECRQPNNHVTNPIEWHLRDDPSVHPDDFRQQSGQDFFPNEFRHSNGPPFTPNEFRLQSGPQVNPEELRRQRGGGPVFSADHLQHQYDPPSFREGFSQDVFSPDRFRPQNGPPISRGGFNQDVGSSALDEFRRQSGSTFNSGESANPDRFIPPSLAQPFNSVDSSGGGNGVQLIPVMLLFTNDLAGNTLPNPGGGNRPPFIPIDTTRSSAITRDGWSQHPANYMSFDGDAWSSSSHSIPQSNNFTPVDWNGPPPFPPNDFGSSCEGPGVPNSYNPNWNHGCPNQEYYDDTNGSRTKPVIPDEFRQRREQQNHFMNQERMPSNFVFRGNSDTGGKDESLPKRSWKAPSFPRRFKPKSQPEGTSSAHCEPKSGTKRKLEDSSNPDLNTADLSTPESKKRKLHCDPPVPIKLFHYTDTAGALGILKDGFVRINPEDIPKLGTGIYFTEIPPVATTEDILYNNYRTVDPSSHRIPRTEYCFEFFAKDIPNLEFCHEASRYEFVKGRPVRNVWSASLHKFFLRGTTGTYYFRELDGLGEPKSMKTLTWEL